MPGSIRSSLARRAAAVAFCGFLCAASPTAGQPVPTGPEGPAAPVAAPAPRWFDAIAVNGFVSVSWGGSFNRPASGTNQLRAFDVDDRSIGLDVASLVLQKPVQKPGDAGFRFDVLGGSSVPRATAAEGLFRDPDTGEAGDFDLLHAVFSWIAPLGRGLRLDVGKFVTPVGYEAIEGYESWNDHATHSFLFACSEPGTHTGLKAGYAFSDVLSASVLVVNGWDDARNRNGSKTVGASVTFTPDPGWTLGATFLHGPERRGNDADDRSHLGAIVQLSPGGAVRAGLAVERGREEGLAAGKTTASWWGVAGYVRWEVSPAFALALRAEHFDDADGVRTGAAQKLREVTLTPALSLGSGIVFRADLRMDLSDREVFEDSDGLFTKKRQATILLNALYAF